MLNLKDDSRKTYFIDIDGTIVKHNYDPDNIDDEFLPGSIEYLHSISNHCIVLTTSRSIVHTVKVSHMLKEQGVNVSYILPSLPTGKRVIINDHKVCFPPKAEAINVRRDRGLKNITEEGNRRNNRAGWFWKKHPIR